jgi:hypothetical protein
MLAVVALGPHSVLVLSPDEYSTYRAEELLRSLLAAVGGGIAIAGWIVMLRTKRQH